MRGSHFTAIFLWLLSACYLWMFFWSDMYQEIAILPLLLLLPLGFIGVGIAFWKSDL